MKRSGAIIFVFLFSLFIFPQPVSAHAFGQLYNLPVPFWLYLYGGATAVMASFLIFGFFLHSKTDTYPQKSFHLISLNWLPQLGKTISLGLFLLTIISGLVGENNNYDNFNMTFFWIIFWLGFTYLTAIIGNSWERFNPLRIISEWVIEKGHIKKMRSYPQWLGYYPAVIFYLFFIFIELFLGVKPLSLSFLLLLYTMITLIGALWVGVTNWFQYGEFFSVYFRLIGQIAPVIYQNNKLTLRPPFVGLLGTKSEHLGLVVFVLAILALTAFDGIRETVVWYAIFPISTQFFNLLDLFLAPFLFLIIFLIFIVLTKQITGSSHSVKTLALEFGLTLMPIAFVYNIAHYYTLLLTQGQEIFRLISDPFGVGWNLFGTAAHQVNMGVINAGVTWHVQVFFILLGHIASVYLAHQVALTIFGSSKKAIISQIPMLLLMVIYTVLGLWILAQPLTGG